MLKPKIKHSRICIVEDNEAVSKSYMEYINEFSDHHVIQTYTNCESAIKNLKKDSPDIIFMDLQLPGMNGIEGIRKIKKVDDAIKIVVITVHEDSEMVFDALCAGAVGYLTKTPTYNKLIDAIDEVLSGGAPMSTKIARMVVQSFENVANENLSRRESEILNLLAKGKTYKSIADELFVHIDTVKTHIQNIYKKLQVNSKAEALQKAHRKRLIN